MSTCPRLLVCEGFEDKHFFRHLIRQRHLPDFRVIDTSSKKDRAGGITKFKEAIGAFRASETRRYNALSDILIIADNGETPPHNFKKVQDQIEALFPGRSPTRPREPSNSQPRVTILMVPWDDEPGSLESLCVGGARRAGSNVAVHVDSFVSSVGGDTWGEPRWSKAWLRTILAARFRDPFVSLADVFRYHEHLIDVLDPCFDGIAQVFESFR